MTELVEAGKRELDQEKMMLSVTNGMLWSFLIRQSIINITFCQAIRDLAKGDIDGAVQYADEAFEKNTELSADRDELIYVGEHKK